MLKSNINSDYITQLVPLIEKFQSELKIAKKNCKGTLNLFDVINKSHFENYHSNILAFLLNENEKHYHDEFVNQFIQIINYQKIIQIPSYRYLHVTREKQINNNRRIDIFLEAENFVIILENKIWAEDQGLQLKDYYEWAKEKFKSNKEVFVCYLTPFGKDPSEYSIPKNKLDELKKDGKYISLSYYKDILRWLNLLNFKKDEKTLQSAILQYIDVIKGICNLREEDKMELKIAINQMKHICKDDSIDTIKQIKENIESIQQSCNYYIFVKFFEILVERLTNEKLAPKIYYTHHQNRFELNEKSNFLDSVYKDLECFGVECALGDSHGLAITIENINNSYITYGIIRHEVKIENNFTLVQSWIKEDYKIVGINNERWIEYVEVPYVVRCLLAKDELEINEIVDNVTYWFVEQLQSYKDQGLIG